jgi:hypothetical protein
MQPIFLSPYPPNSGSIQICLIMNADSDWQSPFYIVRNYFIYYQFSNSSLLAGYFFVSKLAFALSVMNTDSEIRQVSCIMKVT